MPGSQSEHAKNLAPKASGDIIGAVLTRQWTKNLSGWLCLLAWFFYPTNSFASFHHDDGVGQVVKVTDPLGNQNRTFYDAAGRVVRVFDALDHSTGMTYDGAGHVLKTVNALNQTVNNEYDGLGRLWKTTDAEGIVNEFRYDRVGNRRKVIDGKSQETSFVYDALNRVTEQKFANNDTWTYTYNYMDKLTQTDPLGRVISYTYDNLHRLTAEKHVGTTTQTRTRTYYTAGDGRLNTVTEPGAAASGIVTYTYDKLGRVVTEKSWGKIHTYGYDNVGNQVKREVTPNTVKRIVTTVYDRLNRPVLMTDDNETATVPGDDLKTEYGYDRAGRAVLQIAANGQVTRNEYDAAGRLKKRRLYVSLAQETAAGLLAEFEWEHDAIGNVTRQSEVWKASGGQPARSRVTVMTYDDANRLETETITDGADPAVVTVYGYDAANNRTSKVVTGGTDAGLRGHWTLTYNAANQLTRLDKRDSAGGPVVGGASYTYDAMGNRLTRVADGAGTAASRTTEHTWDVWGRLSTVAVPVSATVKQTHTYTYDYRMRRTGMQRTAVTGQDARHVAVVYSGGTSVAEYERTGATTALGLPMVRYARGPDMGGGVGGMLYTVRSPVGTTGYAVAPTTAAPLVRRHALSNGRGDVVAQSDAAGALTWTASYEAGGKRTKETGTNKDRQRANTKEEDPTGLLYEGFRYRDLETMVWLSRDPAGFVDGPNLYAYVKQNPWSKFDPKGLAGKLSKVGEVYERLVSTGYKVGKQTVRNMQFANQEVSSKMLRERTNVSMETLSKLDNEYPGITIKYNEHGRPLFDDYAIETVNVKFENSAKDIQNAWGKIESKYSSEELASLKENFVFHHDWDGESLQLIPRVVHESFQHTGGNALRKNGFFGSIMAFFAPRTVEGRGESVISNIVQDIGEFANPDPGVYDFVIAPAAEAANEYIEKVSTGHPDALKSDWEFTRNMAKQNKALRELSKE